MTQKKIFEYVDTDFSNNILAYYSTIKTKKSCLYCHGNPKLSMTYWQRNNGTDLSNHKMEGWKEGERNSALIVKTPLTYIEAKNKFSLIYFLLLDGFLVILFAIIGFFSFRVRESEAKKTIAYIEENDSYQEMKLKLEKSLMESEKLKIGLNESEDIIITQSTLFEKTFKAVKALQESVKLAGLDREKKDLQETIDIIAKIQQESIEVIERISEKTEKAKPYLASIMDVLLNLSQLFSREKGNINVKVEDIRPRLQLVLDRFEEFSKLMTTIKGGAVLTSRNFQDLHNSLGKLSAKEEKFVTDFTLLYNNLNEGLMEIQRILQENN